PGVLHARATRTTSAFGVYLDDPLARHSTAAATPRGCGRPAAVFGPVDGPPGKRHLRLPGWTLTAHGLPCRLRAPQRAAPSAAAAHRWSGRLRAARDR